MEHANDDDIFKVLEELPDYAKDCMNKICERFKTELEKMATKHELEKKEMVAKHELEKKEM